ncbi:MAG: nucleotide sugar dehydrogenase [Aureispira sp.]|nr:nucleotide sugar dehydrogenase [Aureispira sp.]
MYQQLKNKENTLAVIGLGYVGLPIALAFARKIKVIGFDINAQRVDLMKNNIDPSKELESSAFEGTDIHFTADIEELRSANFYVVAVPTPIDKHRIPNLKPLLSASETVAKVIKKGDYVVFESTVYPGCTEEDCIPIIEKISGLKYIEDFKVGYSPERINPGDKERTIEKIVKVVSGCDLESLDDIAKTYELIIEAGVYKAATIKVAEAAKVIENTQRDLNIALMNELSIIFDKMNINTNDVLAAAGTKWNFLKFFPGLVGGHCIGVDPYYLTYKAQKLGYTPQVILSGRSINDNMAAHVATKTVQLLLKKNKDPKAANVLVMGVTFKENVSDIRNSKVVDVVSSLKDFSVNVDIVDPLADAEEVMHEYGLSLTSEIDKKYDAIIVAVAHDEYKKLDAEYFKNISTSSPIFVDLKSIYDHLDLSDFSMWGL